MAWEGRSYELMVFRLISLQPSHSGSEERT